MRLWLILTSLSSCLFLVAGVMLALKPEPTSAIALLTAILWKVVETIQFLGTMAESRSDGITEGLKWSKP